MWGMGLFSVKGIFSQMRTVLTVLFNVDTVFSFYLDGLVPFYLVLNTLYSFMGRKGLVLVCNCCCLLVSWYFMVQNNLY